MKVWWKLGRPWWYVCVNMISYYVKHLVAEVLRCWGGTEGTLFSNSKYPEFPCVEHCISVPLSFRIIWNWWALELPSCHCHCQLWTLITSLKIRSFSWTWKFMSFSVIFHLWVLVWCENYECWFHVNTMRVCFIGVLWGLV